MRNKQFFLALHINQITWVVLTQLLLNWPKLNLNIKEIQQKFARNNTTLLFDLNKLNLKQAKFGGDNKKFLVAG